MQNKRVSVIDLSIYDLKEGKHNLYHCSILIVQGGDDFLVFSSAHV